MMRCTRSLLLGLAALAGGSPALAQDREALGQLLARPILENSKVIEQIQAFVDPRIPRLKVPADAGEWRRQVEHLRQEVLQKVVFRGEAARWRDTKGKVEWLETIPGGKGYRIKKVRYEAVPGMWIPALLYEPDRLEGKVPVSLAVNGHDGTGKAAGYKQIRCINMARRGMLVLNVEWVGMGQLRTPGFGHARMNQLDLCGTSGLAPFFLSMSRGLDLLLSHPNADPARVAVSGLSGGGWQTIFISGLDPRVTLSNPVAGYSSFRTRLRYFKDLGDSEQTPSDLATVVDYTHLTAMRAPHATLLTYNAKDQCCFEAGYALPPLLEAARPAFALLGADRALRSHINHDPGTHNFEKDNRQALYRMLGDFFYPDDSSYSAEEIPCDDEVKKREELDVPLPTNNADFTTLALTLAQRLPRQGQLPTQAEAARRWQREGRQKLAQLVRAREYPVRAEQLAQEKRGETQATFWKLHLGDDWTLPVVELVRGKPRGTTILLNEGGRRADPVNTERLLEAGQRVLAADLYYYGEGKPGHHDYLFSLIMAAVGERPLGLQASQLASLARWTAREHGQPAQVVTVGPRLGCAALVAAGLEEKAIAGLEMHRALASLKEVIEEGRTASQAPEMFCFGLLEAFDIRQLIALAAPRPVTLVEPGDRARKELGGLQQWYTLLGAPHNPLDR